MITGGSGSAKTGKSFLIDPSRPELVVNKKAKLHNDGSWYIKPSRKSLSPDLAKLPISPFGLPSQDSLSLSRWLAQHPKQRAEALLQPAQSGARPTAGLPGGRGESTWVTNARPRVVNELSNKPAVRARKAAKPVDANKEGIARVFGNRLGTYMGGSTTLLLQGKDHRGGLKYAAHAG